MAVTAQKLESYEIARAPVLIELAGVHKVYRTGKLEYPALRGVDLTIDHGDMVAIVGPSGGASRRS